MKNQLVSIITPCYNSDKVIFRLLDSILEQDYPYIEMYAVDDGSLDNTAKVIQNYIPRFAERGYVLKYFYQENSGQASAINRALKLVQGDYLVWPDSDDFYATSTAISKMVISLAGSNETVSMARCLPVYLCEKDLSYHHKTLCKKRIFKEYLFDDCLFDENLFWYVPGDYIVKMSFFDKCIPNRDIYTEKNAGQNWQLMLPLLYQYKCITIREYLYNVLIRKDSHSRGQYKNFEEVCSKFRSFENTLTNTLERMPFLPLHDKKKYIGEIKEKYAWIQFDTCVRFGRKEEALQAFDTIRNGLNKKSTLKNTQIIFFSLKCLFLGRCFLRKINKFYVKYSR